MPNIHIDYSPNLSDVIVSTELAKVLHAAVIATGVFPTWGVRLFVRAAEQSLVADAAQDQGFIQIMVRVAPGRSAQVREGVVQALFDAISVPLEPFLLTRKMGYQIEIQEFDAALTRNKNSLKE